ncbi:MAG TPA: hypothetical protein VFW98_18500 [Gemmatimonadaceae bacterium]|nr:hypothetical protein [Gemmatimonadaceae bacterium]
MRSIALSLALTILLLGCGGHEQQTPADSAANTAADTAPALDTAQAPPAMSDTMRADSTSGAAGTAAKRRTPAATSPARRQSQPQKQQQKADTTDTTTRRTFKKPEIRPRYPAVDRTPRTDTGARKDTSKASRD